MTSTEVLITDDRDLVDDIVLHRRIGNTVVNARPNNM